MRTTVKAFILATILATSAPAAEIISGIAATVNDEVITIYELNREYAMALKTEEKKGALTAEAATRLRSDLLKALIDRKLIQQKIRELNISVTEEEVRQSIEEIKKQNKLSQETLTATLLSQGMTFDQYKAQMKEQLERLRLMSQEVKSKVQVSEQEQKDYYAANQGLFSDAEAYRASAIFISTGKNPTPEEEQQFKAKVDTALAAAKSGGIFSELAKKYSDDPNAQKDGGDLGFFKKGEMLPDIEKIVMMMKPGDVEMITIAAGHYIIKLEEKKPAVVRPFAAVKEQIEDILYRKKSDERFSQWTEELRKGAAIEIKQ